MEQDGYMLIKVRKTINIYLWAETPEELVEPGYDKPPYQIVPYYKDGEKRYLKIDGKFVRIQ